MLNTFMFDGESSKEYGILITERPESVRPERDITKIEIPGRSGDLIVDNRRYKNIDVSYKCETVHNASVFPSIHEQVQAINIWLSKSPGTYAELKDTYNIGFFRQALNISKTEYEFPAPGIAKFTAKFYCKPFLYSVEGQKAVVLTGAATLYNPYREVAQPNIKIYGSGNTVFKINNTTYTVNDVDGYIIIDTELGDAYKENALQSDKITAAAFPVLLPGGNTISWTGAATKIEIVPRWCTV